MMTAEAHEHDAFERAAETLDWIESLRDNRLDRIEDMLQENNARMDRMDAKIDSVGCSIEDNTKNNTG